MSDAVDSLVPASPAPALTPADILALPPVTLGVLTATQELLPAPTWDDWVDVAEARARFGALALVCRAWTAPAQRLMRMIYVLRREEDAGQGHPETARTVIWTERGPDWPTTTQFARLLARCPDTHTIYCHKPPPGIVLPPTVRALYTTGLSVALAEGGLKAPHLRALSVLQFNPEPYSGVPLGVAACVRMIRGLGCGEALRALCLSPFEDPPEWNEEDQASAGDASKPESIIAALARVAPNLRSLAFADERYRPYPKDNGPPPTLLQGARGQNAHYNRQLSYLAGELRDPTRLGDLEKLSYRLTAGRAIGRGINMESILAVCAKRGIRFGLYIEDLELRPQDTKARIKARRGGGG